MARLETILHARKQTSLRPGRLTPSNRFSTCPLPTRNTRKTFVGFVTSRMGDKSIKVTVPYQTPHREVPEGHQPQDGRACA